MSQFLSKLIEVLEHGIRDILFYFLGGIIIVGNLFLLDFLCLDGKLLNHFKLFDTNYQIFFLIVSCYILGHVIMAFMYLFIEITRFEKLILWILRFKNDISLKKELIIFSKNKPIYNYFIERYNQLFYTRWMLAGGFLISAFIDFVLMISLEKNNLFYVSGINFFLFIILLLVHYKTGEDYANRINQIEKNLQSFP